MLCVGKDYIIFSGEFFFVDVILCKVLGVGQGKEH